MTNVAAPGRRGSSWPVLLLALPAFVAIWSGWVELGTLTGFGLVQPLPGIWDGLRIDSRVTLPIGMEAYAAYALKVWLSGTSSPEALAFARASAGVALVLGAAGQVAYHLMHAAGVTRAPWPVTALVACLPVAVLGMGVALAHLTHKTGAVVPDALVSAPATAPTATAPTAAAAPRIAPARIPRPASPAGASRNGAGARVRELRGDHPDWTSARIGEAAGCSARTVRRSLATFDAKATTTGAMTDYEREAA